jgi:phosphatidate cytidylyltransferase
VAQQASNLTLRLLSAAVAIPGMLALLYLGPDWGWAAFVAVACAIACVELYGMAHPGDRVSQVVSSALTLGVYAALWFKGDDARVLLAIVFLLPLAALLLVLARLGDMDKAALRVMATAFGPLYLGGGLGSLALVRRETEGASLVVLALVLSWASDTGAYFMGRFLGKNKLYEAVSPKKTREGAIGGLLGAAVGALIGSFFYLRSLPPVHAVALAIVGGALGQCGDLGESLLKRSFGVKDSGGIVPGHGGIMDRVDALMVTGIVTYLYSLLFRR